MANIRSKLHQESTLAASIDALDKRVSDVECHLNQILINQNNQQKLLLTILTVQNIPIPTLLDDHNKGDKSTSSTALATTNTTSIANPTPVPTLPATTTSTALATSSTNNTTIATFSTTTTSTATPENPTIPLLNSTEKVPTSEGEPPTKGDQLALVPKSKTPLAAKKKQPPKEKTKPVQVKSIRCQGESSSMNAFKPCLVDPPSLVKPHGKNKFAEDFPMPKHDKLKLLGLAIHMGKFSKKWDETKEEKKDKKRVEKVKGIC